MQLATCKVCVSDFDIESMIEDIEGAKYCLVDSGDICLVCGIYGHDCEGETLQQRADRTNPYLLTTKREGE